MSSKNHSLLQFKFDDFENLLFEPGRCYEAFSGADCRGNVWQLLLYPGGRYGGDIEDPGVSVTLRHGGIGDIWVKVSFILRDALGRIRYEKHAPRALFEAMNPRGTRCFVKRSTILDKGNNILIDGRIHINVHLSYGHEPSSLHMPSCSRKNKMLELLDSEENSDVSFKVGEDIFSAHKLILKMYGSDLFNFCEDCSVETPILIEGVTQIIFCTVLRYVYGEEYPSTEFIIENSKDIIDAANRFGLVGLKLAVEFDLVKHLDVNVDNVSDWFIFADAQTCPLLKECMKEYFLCRSEDALNSESSESLKKSPKLLTELMLELSKTANGVLRCHNEMDASVSDLRKQLREKGIDIDGSKEMLVSRLQDSNKRQRTE